MYSSGGLRSSKSSLTKYNNQNSERKMISSSMKYFLAFASLLILTPHIVSCGGGDIPPKWWLQSKAESVETYDDFIGMVNGKHKGKTLFLDFYMERCPYCYYIVNDFNKLIVDMTALYGESKVAFLKINGPQIKPLA